VELKDGETLGFWIWGARMKLELRILWAKTRTNRNLWSLNLGLFEGNVLVPCTWVSRVRFLKSKQKNWKFLGVTL
jgi:hypothetical protein